MANAASLKTKRYKYYKTLGISITEPLDKTHKKIKYLYDLGFSCEAIANACGTSQANVHNWLTQKSSLINKQNARMVANLTIEDIFAKASGKNFVPIYGLRRRVYALRRMGWTTQEVQSRMNVRCNLKKTLESSIKVTADVHREVARIYDEIAYKKGPSLAAASRSAKLKTPPPAAWDDIDNPGENPQEASDEVLI